MPRATQLLSNVTAGEMSPLVAGRVDLARYPNSAAILLNRLIRTQGAHQVRPGLQFIAAAKDHSKRVRLTGFKFSTVQAYILECGEYYFRFFKDKGQILDAEEQIYEISSPYAEADLSTLYFNQSNDVVFITHQNYPPYRLTRYGHADWRLEPVNFDDGPYLDENTTTGTLQPSGTTGYITLTAAPEMPELLENPEFSQGSEVTAIYDDHWEHDETWDFTDPKAQHTAGVGNTTALSQAVELTEGTDYVLVLTLEFAGPPAGSLTPVLNGQAGTARSSAGDFTETIQAGAAGGLELQPTADFNGAVTKVSLKEVAADHEFFKAGHVGSFWRLKHTDTWGCVKVLSRINNLQVRALVVQSLGATSAGGGGGPRGERETVLGGTDATKSWREGAWSAVRGYPSCSVFHGGRQIYAASINQPQTIWGSKVGDYPNFAPEDEITDSGPFTRTLDADDVNSILWLISGRRLMAGSVSGEWKISGTGTAGIITPTDIDANKDTNFGSAAVRALQAGQAVLFLQRHNRKVRALAYDFATDSYQAPDLTDWSEHITKPGVMEMALQQEPDQTLWALREDGVLPAMIFEPGEKVVGWSRMETAGLFKSAAVIPGTAQSEVWVVVQRLINGQTRQYIECFKEVDWGEDLADCFLVDSGLSYSGPPATAISGLEHLEGEEVAILADGVVLPRQVVSGGKITLAAPGPVKAHVGLPYRSIYKSPRLEAGQAEGTAQGKLKKIDNLMLRLEKSRGGKIGPDLDNLEALEYENAALFSGDLEVNFPGGYDWEGQFLVVQDDPLPLTICAVVPRWTTIDQGE